MAQPERIYTLRELTRLLRLTPKRLQQLQRLGVLRDEAGGYRFRELVAARVAAGLLERGATVRRVREALEGARRLAPDATMLGSEQERWLTKHLRASDARWNVLAQGVMVGKSNYLPSTPEGFFNLDQWDGYPAAQQRLLDTLVDTKVANPLVITGDIHSSWVNDLKADYADESSAVVGTELVGTSITSSFPIGAVVEAAVAGVPYIKYFEGDQRGYVRCDVDRKQLDADFRYVSTIATADATIASGAKFSIESGVPGAQPA